MIKRADASSIKREKATKEQIAENFKRLTSDVAKKSDLKPSLLKIQKTLDGRTFGIIHENKKYFLKYTTKQGNLNPSDFKHLASFDNRISAENYTSYSKAVANLSLICEAQDNKTRLLKEEDKKEDNIIPATDNAPQPSAEKKVTVTSDEKESELLSKLDTQTKPAADMGGETPAPAEEPAAPEMGGGEEAPAEEPAAAPEMGGEEKVDPKKEFQEAVGKVGQTINDLQDQKSLDKKDIKNALNSVISAIGDDLDLLSDSEKESIYKKIKGSQENIVTDNAEEETPEEEVPTEEPAEEKLDENYISYLKKEAKQLLKEQIQQEIIRRRKNILIESIKRKLK